MYLCLFSFAGFCLCQCVSIIIRTIFQLFQFICYNFEHGTMFVNFSKYFGSLLLVLFLSSIIALFQVICLFFLKMELAFESDFLSLSVSFYISQFWNFITFAFSIMEFIAGILGGNLGLFGCFS